MNSNNDIKEQIINSIEFSNLLNNENEKNFSELLAFLQKFTPKYNEEKKKLPYHINLIDELRANENAHSRILTKLLQQQNSISKNHEIFESFLVYIIEKYGDKKEEFRKIEINKPKITQEIKRIDLWIRDKKYAIIFENKVCNAEDKRKQLEGYINKTIVEGFDIEQIYVLYLPPTYDREPSEQTWGEYYNKEIHIKRYLKLSFKDDILPWLKDNVLPNVKPKDKFLSSALIQYINHLEGKFKLGTIYKEMNMELQKFIKEQLGLNETTLENALEIITMKIEEMENAQEQLNKLKYKIREEIFIEYLSNCEKNLREENFNVVNKIEGHYDYPNSIGIKLHNEALIWISTNHHDDRKLFCQLDINYGDDEYIKVQKEKFGDKDGTQKTEIWKYYDDNKWADAFLFLKKFAEENGGKLK